jgi:hypothetical protein
MMPKNIYTYQHPLFKRSSPDLVRSMALVPQELIRAAAGSSQKVPAATNASSTTSAAIGRETPSPLPSPAASPSASPARASSSIATEILSPKSALLKVLGSPDLLQKLVAAEHRKQELAAAEHVRRQISLQAMLASQQGLDVMRGLDLKQLGMSQLIQNSMTSRQESPTSVPCQAAVLEHPSPLYRQQSLGTGYPHQMLQSMMRQDDSTQAKLAQELLRQLVAFQNPMQKNNNH